jgi:hypothetical protein
MSDYELDSFNIEMARVDAEAKAKHWSSQEEVDHVRYKRLEEAELRKNAKTKYDRRCAEQLQRRYNKYLSKYRALKKCNDRYVDIDSLLKDDINQCMRSFSYCRYILVTFIIVMIIICAAMMILFTISAVIETTHFM